MREKSAFKELCPYENSPTWVLSNDKSGVRVRELYHNCFIKFYTSYVLISINRYYTQE